MEDMQKILDLLLPALQMTDNLRDLKALYYDPNKEEVYARFAGGLKKANVALDSGTAMIVDVVRQIV